MFPGPRQRDQQATLDARAFIQGTRPSGGTNIHAALLAAVTQPVTPGTLPVVIFLTDGLPTVGQTMEKSIRDEIAKANTGDRRIFTFGAGLDVNTPLLARLAEDSRATARLRAAAGGRGMEGGVVVPPIVGSGGGAAGSVGARRGRTTGGRARR